MTNVVGTLNVLEAAKIANIERVVFTSSVIVNSGIRGLPVNKPYEEDFAFKCITQRTPDTYGITKLTSEYMGLIYRQLHGTDFVALRAGGLFGPWKKTPSGVPSRVVDLFVRNAAFGKPVIIDDPFFTFSGVVVDGAIRNTISLVEFKEYEVLKYVIFPPFCTSSGVGWMGERKWNTIPKHLQNMMEEVMVETEKDALKYYGNMDKDRLKEVQEKHEMKVIYLTKGDIAKFNQIRLSGAIKDWVYKKAPKFGPPIYDKAVPYIK